jgi:uncharacterized protein YllA (UPF0747 family)
LRVQNLPGFSKLFADYLAREPSVRAFFPCPPSRESLESHAAELRARAFAREDLCNALDRQATLFRSGPKTRENIARLRKRETVAVVTSAVPALFGGALSNYLQCLTTVKLADSLDRDGIPAVPVFWIRSESATREDLCSIQLTNGRRQLDLRTSAGGDLTVPRQISEILGGLKDLAPDRTEDEAQFLALLQEAYSPGTDWAVAFGRLLSAVMEGLGPILIDPRITQDDQAFFSPGLDRTLNPAAIESMLDSRHEQLSQAGYAVDCRKRTPAQGRDETRGRAINKETSQPLDFSSSLTPVLQQRVLPTVATVVGAHELDCLAETMPLFDYFGLQPPVVWPRVSATILDARSRKLLEKYHLNLEELFAGPEALLHILLDDRLQSDPVERFQRLQTEVGKLLNGVVAALPPEDQSLGPMVETSRSKMLYQLGRLQERFEEARALRREAMVRHLDRLCSSLVPGGQLQEHIGGAEFLLRYSRNLLPELYDKIDVWSQEHQAISIG